MVMRGSSRIKKMSWCLAWLISAALMISDNVWLTFECLLASMYSKVQITDSMTKDWIWKMLIIKLMAIYVHLQIWLAS